MVTAPLQPTVLALDLGTKTGWAISGNGNALSGVQTFDLRRGESTGMRFIRFRSWLSGMIKENKIQIIAFESVVSFHKSRYSGEVAHGMAAIVQTTAFDYEVELLTIAPSELKKFATGKGNAPKELMLARATQMFPDVGVIDDNHADALFLLAHAERTVGEGK